MKQFSHITPTSIKMKVGGIWLVGASPTSAMYKKLKDILPNQIKEAWGLFGLAVDYSQ